MPAAQKGEVPQYRLTQQAYIDDRLHNDGDVIYFEEPPGPHMAPLNTAAKAMVEKHKPKAANLDAQFNHLPISMKDEG